MALNKNSGKKKLEKRLLFLYELQDEVVNRSVYRVVSMTLNKELFETILDEFVAGNFEFAELKSWWELWNKVHSEAGQGLSAKEKKALILVPALDDGFEEMHKSLQESVGQYLDENYRNKLAFDGKKRSKGGILRNISVLENELTPYLFKEFSRRYDQEAFKVRVLEYFFAEFIERELSAELVKVWMDKWKVEKAGFRPSCEALGLPLDFEIKYEMAQESSRLMKQVFEVAEQTVLSKKTLAEKLRAG